MGYSYWKNHLCEREDGPFQRRIGWAQFFRNSLTGEDVHGQSGHGVQSTTLRDLFYPRRQTLHNHKHRVDRISLKDTVVAQASILFVSIEYHGFNRTHIPKMICMITGILPVVQLRFLEMALGPLFFLFVLTHLMFLNSAEEEKHHPNCEPFSFPCGKLGEIGWAYKEKTHPDHCGLYKVDCSEENSPKIQLKEGGHWYQISEISQADSIFIDDTELRKTLTFRRCESLEKFGLPSPSLFSSPLNPNIVNLFKCHSSLRITPPTAFYSTSCGD
ncbi:hypothetical protein FNV43_RR26648 [Rhamnella rubrinervis]|uniref:Uncharacterized protein n=1 Tax=Rhamnella rubrinervis TaxID=2594499 RepID=A0A8K0DIY4_9ROSA|nr:hypothetical protein FNV43_RR26648 [Rhamnella rubrinervis]